MIYDLAIIGGGPAGVAAGIYAARKKIESVIITDFFGGQSLISASIENWIGDKSISGFDLAKKLENHLRFQQGIDIVEGDTVLRIIKERGRFVCITKNNKKIEAKTLFIASGSRRRKLDIPGEKEFEGRGVFYCSTCDAPLFKDKVVAVVGAGNAGLEAVQDLSLYAKKIYLVDQADTIKGDVVTRERIEKNEKIKIILNIQINKILGDKFLTGFIYLDRNTSQENKLDIDGVFVEIGSVPNSEIVKDFVEINNAGEIIVDHKTQQTSMLGIWAAGDVTDVLYKQNNISVGDAIKAVLNINEYLRGV
ncbi:MAG: FAD-dependent oxidoreductase [Patescibacteria group bacterium]|nr:FAD-dependent oxidoreductase [Patescibacteria group bacterium]